MKVIKDGWILFLFQSFSCVYIMLFILVTKFIYRIIYIDFVPLIEYYSNLVFLTKIKIFFDYLRQLINIIFIRYH